MVTQQTESALYTISSDGAVRRLDEMNLASEVVAEWAQAETVETLAKVTPEQLGKLHELLHVQKIEPASDGVYVDRSGKWHVVSHGTVTASGYWMVPMDVLQPVSENEEQSVPQPATRTPIMSSPGPSTSTAERDPVCGMLLRPGQEEANTLYQDHTYHFCSDECRKLFLANPAEYIKKEAGVA